MTISKAIERKQVHVDFVQFRIYTLETMFELPEIEFVEEVVISNEVMKANQTLYIYSDQKEDLGNSA